MSTDNWDRVALFVVVQLQDAVVIVETVDLDFKNLLFKSKFLFLLYASNENAESEIGTPLVHNSKVFILILEINVDIN